jgi:signal transduction histidine kinase
MAGDPLDDALPEVLRRIGSASGAGRAVLIERIEGDDGSHMRRRAEWDADGVLPLAVPADPRGLRYFRRWERELSAGHLVAGHLRELPAEERVLLEADGVGSIVVTPITSGGRWWGHVGYDDSHQERDWTGPELDALRAAAGIIGAAVGQAEVSRTLDRRNGILEAVAAAAPLLVATNRIEDGLSALLESIREAVEARSAWAFRIDREAVGHLILERIAPGAMPATAFSEAVALTADGVDRLLADGVAQSYDLFADPQGAREANRRLGVGSWVFVPIIVEGRLRGAIGLDSVENRPWTDGEVIALQVAAAAIAAAVLREATEERLRQAAKMEAVGRVAGSLAHDFGNLLSVVRGWSELLLADSLDDHVREGVEAIELASDRGADLVRDLLNFSRTRSGQIQPVDLAEHVGRVERMLARTVGPGITIEVRADPSVPPALADPAELEHAVVNLVVNAKDALPDGGTIRIATGMTASPTDPMVTLTVSDTGTGMDEATRARVFEPFFSTKPEGLGTGLGLPTAYAAVSAWGGTIDVASELGVGTTFTLRLRPAADS